MLRSLVLYCCLGLLANASAQGVEPFVDHWDAKKTIKRSEGLMVNGREWGEWKFYDREGRLIEQAEFKSGERDGHVRIYYPGGGVQHDGWFKRGVEDSLRVTRYRDGKIMERGAYNKGRKTGPWTYYYPDSVPMLREVWQDTLVLVTDAWDTTGVRTITNGDGFLRTHYASGSVQEESQYIKGVKSGPYLERYPAGNEKVRGQYQGGLKVGTWSFWYSNGKQEKTETHLAGRLHGPYTLWYRSGQVNVSGAFRGGEKDSVWTWYTTAGKKDMEGPFKAGLREGVWKYWYPNGQLSTTGAFTADKEQGEWVYFYEGGQFWKKGQFRTRCKDRHVDHVVRERAETTGRSVREWQRGWRVAQLVRERQGQVHRPFQTGADGWPLARLLPRWTTRF